MKGNGYEITEKNILKHELIGLRTEVIKSSDPSRKGVKGKVIDETQNTIKIFDGETKIVPKKECVFAFDIGSKVVVDGKQITKRPEDRIKE